MKNTLWYFELSGCKSVQETNPNVWLIDAAASIFSLKVSKFVFSLAGFWVHVVIINVYLGVPQRIFKSKSGLICVVFLVYLTSNDVRWILYEYNVIHKSFSWYVQQYSVCGNSSPSNLSYFYQNLVVWMVKKARVSVPMDLDVCCDVVRIELLRSWAFLSWLKCAALMPV